MTSVRPGKEPEDRLLTARETPLKLDANLGKSYVVQGSQEAGFYCPDCNLTFKDNVAFLDHINGRMHLKNIGSSMEVERSSLAQVKARFEYLKTKQHEQVREYDLEESVQRQRELEAEEKAKRREERVAKKKAEREELDRQALAAQDKDTLASMGFGAFGSSKR